MNSIYDFLEEFEVYLNRKINEDVWVYSGHTYFGSLLIKNLVDKKRIILKPSDSTLPVGGKRIQDFMAKTPTFKGHTIDNYIFITRLFKHIAERLAKANKQLTLISVDFKNKSIIVSGSMNIDLNILNHIIEFSNHLKYSISYDFEGLLKHQGFDKKENKAITQIQERQDNPKVFFSYSWDDDEHRFWVLKLASDLIKNGIDVLIDEWDLDKFNNDLHQFMETGIRESDKVIIICTPNYANKANNRIGGVGVENTIITGEFYDKKKSNKFISIIRKYDKNLTDSLPSYLKTKFSLDFTEAKQYKLKQEELIRKILNISRYKKPKLGNLPNLKSDEI
ncbi:MAG: TIR domain-containing protein [Bacteroidales bacterium]|nr:TIR domain-containing protein [Bacteroidales bacterium]